MSSFPQTRRELLRAGYKFLGVTECKGCAASIEFWRTTMGKKLPFNPMPADDTAATTHWSTCPQSKEFRKVDERGSQPNLTPVDRPGPVRHTRTEADLQALLARSNARVVVLVDDHGTRAAWRNDIPAEDLRHDLISAANFVRAEVNKGGV